MNWQTNNPLEAEETLSEASGPKQKLGDFSCDASTNPHPSLHIVILVDRAMVDECKGGPTRQGGGGLHGGVDKVTNLASQRHGTSKGV